jgi:alpha(1,3/1,4) fucosyltransferase
VKNNSSQLETKPMLKVYFTDFWKEFDPLDNFFINLLKELYNVELDSDKPDILFYSYRGKTFLNYRCNRIFFTGENIRPKLFDCDYALSYDFSSNKRIIRLPLYVLYRGFDRLTKPKNIEHLVKQKNKFCSFLVSNKYSSRRIDFFKKLSKYKKVDSGGRLLNNIGHSVSDKWEFLIPYKFNIAFENTSYPGYTTEKVMEPMIVGTIPIYWGNPLIDRDFNTKSFVNCHDYDNDEEVIEKIIELDTHEGKYREMLTEPWFKDNKPTKYGDMEMIKQNLNNILIDARAHTPVGTVGSLRMISLIHNLCLDPINRNLIRIKRRLFGF